MKKSTKILLSFFLVILVTSLILVGCDKNNANDGDATNGKPRESTDYPTGPIDAICPWSAGGSSDVAFRAYLKYMAEELGVDINVQNVTGGDGDIGYSQALAAEPDGHTLVMLNYDILSNEAKGITDTSYKDFAIINMFTVQDVNLVTHSDYGWETFEDFKQAALNAKANGEKLKIGVTGFWLHAAGMMAKETGITDCVTMVPFNGSSDQISDLLGKHCDAITTSITAVLPHLQSGALTVLGTMGTERDPDFPDVPTFIEMGYDVVIAGFRAVATHKDTDPAVLKILRDAGKAAFENPKFNEWAEESKIYHVYMDYEESEKYLEELAPKVEATMKDLGLI